MKKDLFITFNGPLIYHNRSCLIQVDLKKDNLSTVQSLFYFEIPKNRKSQQIPVNINYIEQF